MSLLSKNLPEQRADADIFIARYAAQHDFSGTVQVPRSAPRVDLPP